MFLSTIVLCGTQMAISLFSSGLKVSHADYEPSIIAHLVLFRDHTDTSLTHIHTEAIGFKHLPSARLLSKGCKK